MILTQANCTFVCPLLAGTIQIIETQVTDFNGGSQALTKNTKLIHTGSCAALNGAPCPNPLNLLPWELGSFQCNIRINGVPVLNEHAAKVCRIGQVRVGCIVSPWAVNASILTPLMDMELPVSAASANVTDCSKSALKPSTVTENSETNYSTEKTPEQMNSKKEFEQEGEKDSYFSKELDRCDSAKCPKRAECEYLKASSTLSDRESKQPSKDLRDNAKAEDKAYEEWQNSLMESERMKWGNEAHHLISIFAAFNQYPHLVKLAHFYGYEINCKENCIFLPSISRKESNKLPDQY